MKASDYIIDYLLLNEIDKIFGYIGGMITHITDSIAVQNRLSMINTINEQGAGFAAEGYARTTGKTGVAIATSGPGATNLITCICSCYFDSVPTLFITGQVNTYEYKYKSPVRQIGFQETDICSIVRPVTKYAVLIDDVKDLRYELEKALFLTRHGRKGPVLIDIPMNIQRAEIDMDNARSFFDSEEYAQLSTVKTIDDTLLGEIKKLLTASKRPLVLVGGGLRFSGAEAELNEFLARTNIPMVHSLMGKDIVSTNYKYNMGFIGSYGNRYGNLTLANTDLLFVLGSRLDTRQTGTNLSSFARGAKIVHVDIDTNELGSKIKADIMINADVKSFLHKLNKLKLSAVETTWHESIINYKNKYPSTLALAGTKKIPNLIVMQISECSAENDIFCVDVGQNQMWVAQTAQVKANQRFLFSGGMGAMGFALPTAIGAAIATGRRAIVIVGDGGMQMNIQELEVIKRRNLPVKIIVLNNSCLGMVRQFQETYFHKRYISTIDDYSAPDFAAVGQAYGIKSSSCKYKEDEIMRLLVDFLRDDVPGLMNIYLPEQMTDVEPKLIVGYPIEDMCPFLSRKEFLKDMIISPMKE